MLSALMQNHSLKPNKIGTMSSMIEMLDLRLLLFITLNETDFVKIIAARSD